jgi:hypothetical protein
MVVAAGAREDHELIASSGRQSRSKRILEQASDCGPLMEEMGAHLTKALNWRLNWIGFLPARKMPRH